MKKRILSGIFIFLFYAVMCIAAYYFHIALNFLILLLVLAAVYEVSKVISLDEEKPLTPLIYVYALSLFTVISFFCKWYYILSVVVLFVIAAVILKIILKRNIKILNKTLFLLIYPVLPFFCIALASTIEEFSLISVLLILLIASFADMFALLFGITIKGPKLCPKISPNKTVAGAIGGIIGGVAAALIVYLFFEVFNISFFNETLDYLNLPVILIYVILGFLGAILCEAGDLFASYIKRRYSVKDYGNLIPGHGGIMDRFDGIIFTSVLICVILYIIKISVL